MKKSVRRKKQPPQHQNENPGLEELMHPQPESILPTYRPAGKLKSKVAIITGGDSGIGRAVALNFCLEKASIVIVYLSEHQDAEDTARLITKKGGKCLLICGDIGDPDFCKQVVEKTLKKFKKIDILVNNAVLAV